MATRGWRRLLEGVQQPWKPESFPIPAYSEYMPPPRIDWRPYGGHELTPFADDDPFGWQISEYEEQVELRPGLAHLAQTVLRTLEHLGCGRPAHGMARAKLMGNPYWPPELSEHAGRLDHERYVVLLPLALSRTQDDKGRVRWTLFGGSEQGPERAFWRSFYTAPRRERPAGDALDFVRRLLSQAYGESDQRLGDLRRAGLRILPTEDRTPFDQGRQEALPSWTAPYLWRRGESVARVKYLLTFRPFQDLPPAIRRAYLAGELHLLPFPGSLVFWGAPPLLRLSQTLPLAMQIPLLNAFERYESPRGLRIPQSGWMHEPHPDQPVPDPIHGRQRNTYVRTHRWARIHRHQDELAVLGSEERVAHVLFSAAPEDVGLYGKPMARNAQVWTHDYELLLDGPRASRADLERAAAALRAGGHFGYRFLFPAMRVGLHEVYWQRPLVAYRSPQTGAAEVLGDAPTGYLTAYSCDRPRLDRAVELWPRLLDREPWRTAVRGFVQAHEHQEHQAAINVRQLLGACQLVGEQPLPQSFARHLLTLPKVETLDGWLRSLEALGGASGTGRALASQVEAQLEPSAEVSPKSERSASGLPEPLTYPRTASRAFNSPRTAWAPAS